MTNNKTSMKELLIKFRACDDAREWAGTMTIEEIVDQCHRGDWLLWLAKEVDIELQAFILAKGHCANTVRHLMQDERSVKAIDIAIAFGEGNVTKDELRAAASAAASAHGAAAHGVADAYGAAAAHSAAAGAAYAAAGAAYAVGAASDARMQNQTETANLCRKYIGQLIIDKCNKIQGGNK
jgi:hypothetical protein